MVAVTGMDFLVHKLNAAAPVKVVPKAGAFALFPDPLNLLTPTGFHDLVQVQADANVDVFGNQSECRITGMVKAPRRDADVVNYDSVLAGQFHHTVSRAGVGNEQQVSIFSRVSPAFYKLLFVLADCVYANFQLFIFHRLITGRT